MSTTLVTGFPRLLSKLVARELLARGADEVVLLVRPRYVDDARRFIETLGANVRLLEGDATAIDLGLGGAEYLALARRLTRVHHAAQAVWEGAETRAVTALNVQGTHEVLELARTARSLGAEGRVVAYSSTLVAGDWEGLVREGDLELGQRFRTEVERSLYEAERMLRRASSSVPVTVVRPSIVVGHSETGEIDVFDGPYLFLLLLLGSPVDITLPLPGGGAAALNVVPADHVARAGVTLGEVSHESLRTFHVVDPHALPARRVFELLAAAAGRRLPRSTIPVNLTRALLRTPGIDRLARSPRAFVERLAARTVFDAEGAAAVLTPAGVACPPFERYANTLVRYTRERLAARRVRPDATASVEPEVDDPLA